MTDLEEDREQKQAEHQTQLEEREDEPQQTKDQFGRGLVAK